MHRAISAVDRGLRLTAAMVAGHDPEGRSSAPRHKGDITWE
jgi:hypothetical protein